VRNFNNKVAAITGAASGIGRSLALTLARENCALALSDVNEIGLQETADKVRALGVKVTTTKVNVADQAAMHAWAAQVVKEHGKVNLIFNNAGVALGSTVEDTKYEDYEWIMGINLWGVIYGTKAFLPYLKQAGEGHVVNVSSIFGLFSQPTQSGYNMTKFAVRGFTESLRQELDIENGGVSATCVHPGGIKTNIARNARMDQSVLKLTGGKGSTEKMTQQFEKLFSTSSDQAAQTILNAVRRDARRVLIGSDAKAADIMQRLLPVVYQKLVTASFKLSNR